MRDVGVTWRNIECFGFAAHAQRWTSLLRGCDF